MHAISSILMSNLSYDLLFEVGAEEITLLALGRYHDTSMAALLSWHEYASNVSCFRRTKADRSRFGRHVWAPA